MRLFAATTSSLRVTMILILMGVSGSGKSTVAQALASLTGWQSAEGDAFHSEDNRAKMSAGVPLSDEDRIPWLMRLRELLMEWHKSGQCGILTCSALRQQYRESLCDIIPRRDAVSSCWKGRVRFLKRG